MKAFSALNFGLTCRLVPHLSLRLSGGRGLQNAREQGRYSVYAGLLATS